MRIILSSTLADLSDHRAAVFKAFQDLDPDIRIELVRSEDMGASTKPPVSTWLDQFDSSDWFILLLGWRYGYIPEGEEKSLPELEYEYAKEHVGTVICFVSDDRYPVPPKYVETGNAATKLRRFKERVGHENIVRMFTTPADLAQKIVAAITKYYYHPMDRVGQDILDKPELELIVQNLRDERSQHIKTINELRRRLGDVVPAAPIWRSRRFEIDTTLGFCLLPFHEQFMQIYEQAIVPAFEASGLRGLHAGQIFDNREIIEDIWESICTCRLVVADVTGRNANVFYELGICHTLGKEVIVITQDRNDVPFDIRHRRFIEYHPERLASLKGTLQQTVQRVLIRANDVEL
jgi:hypothetical protein